VTPVLAQVLDVKLPDASFYLWAGGPGKRHRIRPRPAGSIQCDGAAGQLPRPRERRRNPGAGRVRMALVADTAECLEAAQRIARFVQKNFA
jgi:N-succinyldiaminopimelate aminotransferase